MKEQFEKKRWQERSAQRKSLVSLKHGGIVRLKFVHTTIRRNVLTDHRINKSIYNLDNFMNGDIQEMIDALKVAENAEKLKGSRRRFHISSD